MKITLTELQRECRLDFVKAERVLKFLEQKKIDELDSQANRAKTQVKQLLADIEDYKQTFDLQHKRYVEANLYWQKATGRLHTWNDLGELLKFLMDRIIKLETPTIISGEPFRVEKVDSKQSV